MSYENNTYKDLANRLKHAKYNIKRGTLSELPDDLRDFNDSFLYEAF